MDAGSFIAQAEHTLRQAGITTPRLDAFVLLADALKKEKSWILAHPEYKIPPESLNKLNQQVAQRARRIPLAYIRGKIEFYGRNFTVNPDVLIPRPETEALIEQILALTLPDPTKLLDVGTGSGAVAITAALERPHMQTEACDISTAALAVAEENAGRLGAQVYFFESDLLDRANIYDIIVANLPYVAPDWQRSPETNAEPRLALFANDNGLTLIKKLIQQAPSHLNKNGYLLLEADPRQFNEIIASSHPALAYQRSHNFNIVFQKV